MLEQLGWAEEPQSEKFTLDMAHDELVRAVDRLHGDAAAASLGSCISRPKDDEA